MKEKGTFPWWCCHVPNLLTTVNIVMGVLAIFLLIGVVNSPRRALACVFVLVGALADALDGKAARFFDAESPLGKQLDSFADSITFGLAPAVILRSFPVLGQTPWLLPILTLYAMSGFFRLARFNLGDFKQYFLGLPITVAGSAVAVFALLLNTYCGLLAMQHQRLLTAVLLLVLSGLMVSKMKISRPQRF